MFHILFMHSPVSGQLGLLLPLGYYEQHYGHRCANTICTWAYKDPPFIYFEYIPRSGISGSYASLFLFWGRGEGHTIFQSNCVILLSTSNVQGSKLFTSQPTLVIFCFASIIAILMGVMWYLTVVSICISLMINDVERLFMFCWPLCIFFGERSIQVLCPFFLPH